MVLYVFSLDKRNIQFLDGHELFGYCVDEYGFCASSAVVDRRCEVRLEEYCRRVGLAVVLWGVFWLGDKASAWLFDFARPQVELIYGMKTGENPWLLSILLLILIGPAEEIFWRGYVQNALSKRWSPNVGFIVTTLVYALVHIWSFNFMLVMAALVVGAIWGLAYRLYPQKLGALIVSHAVWDVAVFVVFPI